MSSALEAFRAQREAVEELQARVRDLTSLLESVKDRAEALASSSQFRQLLQDEAKSLARAEDTVRAVRDLREDEMRRYWPGVWRRWVVAVAFALASVAALGGGHVWAARPYEAELVSLRRRVELLDFVGQRVIRMTPTERRQFDVLMKWNTSPGQ